MSSSIGRSVPQTSGQSWGATSSDSQPTWQAVTPMAKRRPVSRRGASSIATLIHCVTSAMRMMM
jgi:hypothetical protein